MRKTEKKKNMEEFRIRKELDKLFPDDHMHIVLKCYDLIEPTHYSLACYSNHCGEHTAIVRACIDSTRFQSLMNECRTRADSLWASGENMIRVICICERGWHTSVAVACILKAFYSAKGYDSFGPRHLSRNTWYNKLCKECEDCQPNDKKEEMFRTLACASGDLEHRCHKTS